MSQCKITFLFLLIFTFQHNVFCAEMIFTYKSKESKEDPRHEYDIRLLKLALDKTVVEYGPYLLKPSRPMNLARAVVVAETGQISNFIVKLSINKELINKLGYVAFPVDLGIVGYRVFFASPQTQQELTKITTLEQLKGFTIGQGMGWLDVEILRHNGFKVHTVPSYSAIFKMVAHNRIDLFSRGINEILPEYKAYQQIKGLVVDKSILLYYPLPRFFFTTKTNTIAIERISKGLKIAYNDGSLMELWLEYYWESIKFSDIKGRKFFKVENPYLDGLDDSYKEYIYKH